MNFSITHIQYPAARYDMTPRHPIQITDLIIHHSAGNPKQTCLEIDQEHRGTGDAMIAYNYIIGQDGSIYTGRPVPFVPAASFGRNTESIAVCLLGNFQSDDAGYTGPPPDKQIQALEWLAVQIHKQFPTIVRTIGHRDIEELFYANDPTKAEDYGTACPGDKLYVLLPSIKTAISNMMKSK